MFNFGGTDRVYHLSREVYKAIEELFENFMPLNFAFTGNSLNDFGTNILGNGKRETRAGI